MQIEKNAIGREVVLEIPKNHLISHWHRFSCCQSTQKLVLYISQYRKRQRG